MKITNLVFAASFVITDISVDGAVSGVRGSKKTWQIGRQLGGYMENSLFCQDYGTNEEQCSALSGRPEKCVWSGHSNSCISATICDDIEAEKDWASSKETKEEMCNSYFGCKLTRNNKCVPSFNF
mmetsp:Transcript_3512/g.7597  ORF Transcript_3512/g.7597 Transcript_3512/m.7597 type:complete len:125 (-) Transcript_3512:4575-4949(-)